MTRTLTLLAAATVALVVAAVASAVGELTQKPGTAGCISDTGSGDSCQDGTALQVLYEAATSPDGKSVYVSSADYDAVVILDRDSSGALAPKQGVAGCVSETGTSGACQDGIALLTPSNVTVSPDSRSVYVTSWNSDSIVIFDRNVATGELTQKAGAAGCVSDTGTGGACQDGKALDFPYAVTVSPDGKNAYSVSGVSDAIAIFDRDQTTGALTQKAGTAGCISETGTGGTCQDGIVLDGSEGVVVSPDGKNVYVGSNSSDAVAGFARDPATGALTQPIGACVSETGTGLACQDGKALDGATRLASSPDGGSIYVAVDNSNAVAILDRNPTTGALTQKAGTAGCISDDGTGGLCQIGRALDNPRDVAVSADNTSVYVTSDFSDGLAVFDRDPATGVLAQKAGTAGCVTETGTSGACQDGTALDNAYGISTSADGRSVYVTTLGGPAAVAILDRATPPPPPTAPPPPPPPPPGPPARDRVAPIVSGFAVAPKRFPAGGRASFGFRLSERANTGIVIERVFPGRRVGRRCLAPSRKLRKRARCTRFKRAGMLTFRNRPAGQNRIAFRGRIGRRGLARGGYRATITATDAAGNRSRPRRAAFTVVRPRDGL